MVSGRKPEFDRQKTLQQAMELFWLVLIAGFATAGHYSMTRAFAVAPVAVTQPVTFLQLVWASLLGWFVFLEPIDPWVGTSGTTPAWSISFRYSTISGFTRLTWCISRQ